MKNICRFIIYICIFIISVVSNAVANDSTYIPVNYTDTISAVQCNDYDILYSKNNGAFIQAVERRDSINVNNKESDNPYDGGLKYLQASIRQFENLLSYIYTQSFLRNKAKVDFQIALSEIHPNAP